MMLFSRSSQPPDASSFAKHFSSTPTAMNAAVDAPGEAPSRATIEWSVLPNQFGAEFEHADVLRIGFDDLDPLTGHRVTPVVSLRLGEELLEHREVMRAGLQHLTDQIFLQIAILARHRQHRPDAARLDRAEQVRMGTVFEELAGKARIGAEQQRPLAVDDARVEMGHGHRRRAFGCLAVDLGVVARAHLVGVAAQPDTADRKAP